MPAPDKLPLLEPSVKMCIQLGGLVKCHTPDHPRFSQILIMNLFSTISCGIILSPGAESNLLAVSANFKIDLWPPVKLSKKSPRLLRRTALLSASYLMCKWRGKMFIIASMANVGVVLNAPEILRQASLCKRFSLFFIVVCSVFGHHTRLPYVNTGLMIILKSHSIYLGLRPTCIPMFLAMKI